MSNKALRTVGISAVLWAILGGLAGWAWTSMGAGIINAILLVVVGCVVGAALGWVVYRVWIRNLACYGYSADPILMVVLLSLAIIVSMIWSLFHT